MSDKPRDDGNAPSGTDGLDEAAGGSLPPNPELEELAREAAASVDELQQKRDLPEFFSPGRPASAEAGEPEAPIQAEEEDEALALLRKELEELHDRHLRLQADFENQRRRTLKERQEAHQYGHENLVKDLLATVDNLDRAIEHASGSDGEDFQGMLQGVELVRRELLAAFAKHGVGRVEAMGENFDPNIHEAMAQQESDEVPANTVVQVFQTGYKLRDRLLRPARVVVSKPGSGAAAADEKPTRETDKAEGSAEEREG